MKFKVGDKIKIVKGDGELNWDYLGRTGEIIGFSHGYSDYYNLKFDNKKHGDRPNNWSGQYLELVTPQFHVGQRVKNIEDGTIDVVKSLPGMPEYDKQGFTSASSGFVLDRHNWEFQDDWEPLKEEKPETTYHVTAINAVGETLPVEKLLEAIRPMGVFSSWNPLSIPQKKGGIMAYLRTIPSKIKRFLNANYKKFYQLGWVDEDLDLTGVGQRALIEMLLDKHEDDLGAVAAKKVAELKKAEKEEDEE
jgi:hypothetical protein